MSITKKQKKLIEKNLKALTTLLTSEQQLIELLYSPFNPTTAHYIGDQRIETKVQTLLDFIKFGRQRYDDFQLENLVTRYANAFNFARNPNTKLNSRSRIKDKKFFHT